MGDGVARERESVPARASQGQPGALDALRGTMSEPTDRAHGGPGARQPIRLLEPFLAMEVMERAAQIERSGIDVVHLELGEPDFDPPPEVREACIAALVSGETRYADSRGLPELREAIAADLARRHGVAIPSERVLVCGGTSPAMLLAYSLLVGPGDEVVMATPHYPCYPNFVRFCGGVPVLVATDPAEGHVLDVEAVRRARTARTVAIAVNSPANPTGAVQSAETLQGLAELGLPLISDEIYDGLVYDGGRARSALEVSDSAFVLDGFSKRYAMTGFRLGYMVVPEWATRPLQVMLQNLFISANPFVQRAGIAALQHGQPLVERMRQAYQARRDLLVAGLRELGFGVPRLPGGAFYVLADARRFGSDSLALAFELLERAHVGTTPGVDFGSASEGMLRFCYAASESAISEALERLARVLPELEARRAEAGNRA
jgi:aspartate/methionine/tyrosine aminotransferase